MQDELQTIRESLQNTGEQVREINTAIVQALADISDIVEFGFSGSAAIENSSEDIENSKDVVLSNSQK